MLDWLLGCLEGVRKAFGELGSLSRVILLLLALAPGAAIVWLYGVPLSTEYGWFGWIVAVHVALFLAGLALACFALMALMVRRLKGPTSRD
jgi:hypothetical protein